MNPKKVLIVGCGKVGACFVPVCQMHNHEVFVYDHDELIVDKLSRGEWPHAHNERNASPIRPATVWTQQPVDVALIVVPTPSLDCGNFDDSMVQEAISTVEGLADLIIVISTVSPDTDLGPAVYAPVMIQLGDVVRGIMEPGYWLVGHDDPDVRSSAVMFLKSLVAVGLHCEFPPLTREEAICSKIFVNFYLTMKISAANAIGLHCREAGLDAIRITKAMGLDPRIGDKYFRPGEPFGGPCLPRDVEAVIAASGSLQELGEAVYNVNEEVVAYAVSKAFDENKSIWLVGGMQYRQGSDLAIESFGQRIQRRAKLEGVECNCGALEDRPDGYFIIATQPGVVPVGTPDSFDPFVW